MAIVDREALKIVTTALDLRRSMPALPALQVLDAAMDGHHSIGPNFEDASQPGGDHTDPRAEFGQLLREAFATHLTPEHCREADIDLDEAWQFAVMEPFAERYDLW